jgi:hypothetical protein
MDLFRSGNANSARLDAVRVPPHPDPDVDVQVDGQGRKWVEANDEGVSSFEAVQPGWAKPWRLPTGTYYSTCLELVSDTPGHWQWAPSYHMLLSDYVDALRTLNVEFRPLFVSKGVAP